MLPELALRSPEADWDRARWETLPADGNRYYARAGVPEYWIVRPAGRDVLVCSQPDAMLGDYAQVQHVAPDSELVSPTLPIHAPIAGFFAGVPDTTL
jgi:Uma2 family endonuclease